jgi:glycosyltransferase involved in cell wall biosynthesis
MATCYTAADVFVGPSLSESFGQVFVEAMACGVPCVGFNTTAVPEVVRHMETGYLAEHKDSIDLARGIQRCLSDEALRRQMSRRCREIAEREYTLEREVQCYVEVYRSAIAQHHIPQKNGRLATT